MGLDIRLWTISYMTSGLGSHVGESACFCTLANVVEPLTQRFPCPT
uniref:Uncharacterized protein n=1 Tax=Rhizophora mucronata TaxID=61149 RepID=A0A2P2NMF4_RHIMU